MLEFLNVENLDGQKVVVMDDLRSQYPERFTESGAMDHKWFEETIRPVNFIYVRRDKNSLSFTIQNGPIKEVGVNGCQIDHIVMAVVEMLKEVQTKHPCKENACAITKFEEGLHWLEARKRDREKRNVEGTSKQ